MVAKIVITLNFYEIIGYGVLTFVNEEKPAGNYEVGFSVSGRPASGIWNPASSIYFYQLKVGSFVETKKMILIR